MADAVATLNSVVLARTGKFFRVMEAEGVDWSCFQLPIDSVAARENLAKFLKGGCLGDQAVNTTVVYWQKFYKFYRDFCGLETDFYQARVPDPVDDFTLVLGIPQGLTPNRIYEACAQHFKCWRYTDDLDANLDWSQEERNSKNGSYVIWVKNTQEADQELKELSANQIKERAITTETLTERLLHGLMYWSETGKHLDIRNITRCTGSRYQNGSAPRVCWYGGKVDVDGYGPQDASVPLCPRVVVS